MTPKEKAKELVGKMVYSSDPFLHRTRHSIKCALICVDEILNTESLANRICGYTTLTKSHVQYWEEVKNEIEKL